MSGPSQTGEQSGRLRFGDFDDAALSGKVLTCFSGLLNVELVGEVEEVGVDEAECLRGPHFSAGLGVKDEFNPALSPLCLDVVLDRSTYLAFAQECSVDKPVQKCLL